MASPYVTTVLADHPTFYCRLDELSGSTAADASGNGHTGTYSGVTLGTDPAVSDGTSISFPSGVNGVSIPTFPKAQTYPFSIEVWVKIIYTGYWGTLFGKVTNSGWGDGFGIFSLGDPHFRFWVGSYTIPGVNFDLPLQAAPGYWTPLVATYDGTTGNIYLNGMLAAAAAMAPGTISNAAPLWFGNDGNGFGWTGEIDEIAFYDYVLSPTRVQAHYVAATLIEGAAVLTGNAVLDVVGTDVKFSGSSLVARAGMTIGASAQALASIPMVTAAELVADASVIVVLELADDIIRYGAAFYPFPEVGAPDVVTTIDSGILRPSAPLYALPATEGPVDNTVGNIIIYTP